MAITQEKSNDEATRKRTFSWENPLATAEIGRGLSGLEYLRKMLAGEIPHPPISLLMNFFIAEIDDGRAVFRVEPAEYHYNLIGMVHGGVAATLLDSAMGCAIHTKLPANRGYTTLEIKVNYIRPMTTQTGKVRCEGRVIHAGNRTAIAEGKIVDSSDKLYANATTTCMIFRP
jgi:uncharacterized protein (TIGR00369 family)